MGDVRVGVEGPITTIWMDRPDRRNAVDRGMAGELRAAFEEFEADPDQRVAILAGSGGTFCAGADLTAVGDPARRNELDPEGGGGGPMGPTRTHLSKPLIAAISGYAVAGVWSWRCWPTCALSSPTRCWGCSAAAGGCRSSTAARSGCRGSSVSDAPST